MGLTRWHPVLAAPWLLQTVQANEQRVAAMRAKNGATRLGFGCAAIPGPLTRREALTLLETAYACGIRHFDTARMYSSGYSEGVLGELVRQRRGDLTIITKAGIAPTSRITRGLNRFAAAFHLAPSAPLMGRFEVAQIQQSVETSLRNLKTDHVEALLLHEIRAHEVHDDLKRILETLRTEGKIGAYGIATSIEDSEALIASHPDLCEIVQVAATWLDRRRVLPANTRLIVHSVLGTRLPAFLNRLKTEEGVARRFEEETGLTRDDAGQIGRLMLQAAMSRNPHGITLFSSARADRIRHDAELLTAKLDTSAVDALERAIRAPEVAVRHDREPAP
jgi:D-threo-aldose 1-dehydrogenase